MFALINSDLAFKAIAAGRGAIGVARSVAALLVTGTLCLFAGEPALGTSLTLQGQNKGDTNTWIAGNLSGWLELDYIPCRVYANATAGGSVQTVTINFPHLSGTTPGIQNLTAFTASPNAVITAGPTLSAPLASGTWSYTFTFKVTNSSGGTVRFLARLAAGAHLNPGSSLRISGDPSSMGNVQIHKPGPGLGAPDLAALKTGVSVVRRGQTITYTVNYTNKAPTGTTVANGTQISDILPPEITIIPATISGGGSMVGNTIFWDVGNLSSQANGAVSFQATVNSDVPYSHSFTNFSQILSAEDDANYADNSSSFMSATVSCVPPSVVLSPTNSASCPGSSITFTASASGTGPFTYFWRKDGALLAQTSSSLTLSPLAPSDSATYSVEATGACGTVTNCAYLTVPALPTITCVSNKTVEIGVVWTFDQPTANYPIGIVGTTTNVSGHCGNTFDATRTWATADKCGNSVQCSQTVTIADTAPPIINCSITNKTVEVGTAWSFDPPTATDNGGTIIVITIVRTVTNTVSHCGNTFDATRTWTATDACGNSSQCSQTVKVVDTTPPIVNCSNTNKSVQLGTAWSFDPPTATDNGGTNIVTTIVGTTTNVVARCGNTFDATRTWVATDACGNSSQCSQTVNVVDTTPPVINCSNTNKTVPLGTAWSFDAPTATDNGGTNIVITIVCTTTNVAGHCGNTFDVTRTWAATDACGNSSQCSQTVNVVDTTPPVINCSITNKTVEIGTAWSFDPPTATDNGGTNIVITIVRTVTNTVSHCGNTFDATRTWAATDACGNSSQCSQTVKVVDTTPPIINCSNTNKTIQLGTAWNFDRPTATDNGGTNIVITIVGTTTNIAAHCGNTFDATRTWVATDACGNSSQCSQTVNVQDTTPPVINCSNTNKTVQLGTAWSFDPPTATDNRGTNIVITIVSTTTNIAGHCGNTFDVTRTWAATDACGNSSQCSQTVNVVDTTTAVINCSSTNRTVQLGTAWSFDPPTATDNSGSNIVLTIVSTTTNVAGHCGNAFDATRTWAATDACGNSSQCSQTVNLLDTTPPVINCSNTNKTVEMGTAWTFDAPTATDNGGTNIAITIVRTVTNIVGRCGNTFDATRTWVAADACGNSSQCSQTVHAVDTTPPMINCSNTNKTVQLGTAWSFDPPKATDNGGTNVVITIVGTTTNVTGHCGDTFDATRTWAATDACGNSSQCSQTVHVVDMTPPVIICSITNKTVHLGSAWSFDPPTATDNGGTNIVITIVSTTTNVAGHCGNAFDATRTWAATDACGNSSQCSQTVNVTDTMTPIINCSSTNKTVQLGTAWSFDPPMATDNSGTNIVVTIVSTTTNIAGHCGNTFDATRTWAATDACGNSSQCSQTVNVVDTTPPVINCNNTNKTIEMGTAWTFDAPTATDNGGTNIAITIVRTVTNSVGRCGNTFDATRTWAATDACGNSSQCSQTVHVVDTTPPVINCSNTNKSVEIGMAWSFDPPTATDNSGTNIVITIVRTVTNILGHCGNSFDATRTWAATDACGNSSQCSQTVNVMDTTPPIINCSNTNKTVQLGAAWSFDVPTATDNGGTNIVITIVGTTTNVTGHCGDTFDATRTWAAMDACGNSSQCSQTVHVVDTTPPAINCSITNKTVQLGTAWSFDQPTATDNGGTNIVITIVGTKTNVASHCGSSFDATRTWAAMDACGNSSQCSQTVNVLDATPPVINCNNTNKTVEMGTAWTFDAPTATDNGGTNIAITIVRTVTNIVGRCGNTFDATRTWAATDACGNSSQCSQTVHVVDTTPPVINCSITNKAVEIGAAWVFDIPTATDNSGTNIAITVVSTTTNISGHCGNTFDATRTWAATDACGNSAQCSQTVTLSDTTPPAIRCSNTNKTVQLGTAWSFDTPTATDNGGTNIVITVINTTTNLSGLCGGGFDTTRTWAATDACGNSSQCSQTVNVTGSTKPTVSIVNPTNGSIFIAPANFTVLANAQVTNSTITRVAFYSGTNFLGEVTNGMPYLIEMTNRPVVTNYPISARATDACGNVATSAVVRITILPRPPLSVVSAMAFDPRTGLYTQTVRVSNPTYSIYDAVRVYVYGLTSAQRLYNATGTTNGVPYVQSAGGIAPGSYVDFVLEYYVTDSSVPAPTLITKLVTPDAGGTVTYSGTSVPVHRMQLLANKNVMIEFSSISGRVYYVQYRTGMGPWKTAQPGITGNGGWIQWVDDGQPKTESAPGTVSMRLYRVILMQ